MANKHHSLIEMSDRSCIENVSLLVPQLFHDDFAVLDLFEVLIYFD